MLPGHFYSPIPSLDEIRQDDARIFKDPSRTIAGVDLRENAQLELIKSFAGYYAELPFRAEAQPGLRYYFDNPAFGHSDAIFLFCMIRHAKPKRMIEVGSGYSSCVALDTNELFFGNSIQTTFIEPFPELLDSHVTAEDRKRIRILPHRLQDIAIDEFQELQANDILFIDSTHVSKVNSDVNRLFFEILPALSSGVYIHIHDVFFPFEYPREWIYGGRAWNELYILRAFLQYNARFQIELMNSFLQRYHRDFFESEMPLCLENPAGSIWLRKV